MCLSLSRSASLMKGILSVSLSSFHRFPSLLEISALCMSGDCSMIFLLSICDHTINAFMGLLMWPLGVLHHAGLSPSLCPEVEEAVEAGERGEAAGSRSMHAPESALESPAKKDSASAVLSVWLIFCTMLPSYSQRESGVRALSLPLCLVLRFTLKQTQLFPRLFTS